MFTTSVGNTIVPQRMSAVLRFQYCTNAFSFATLQSAYVAISLNGVYDPLYTLGGGSCTGFAELMALYNRYIVTKSLVRMQLYNTSTNSVGNNLIAFIAEVPASQTNLVGTVISEDILEARRTSTIFASRGDAVDNIRVQRLVDIVQLEGLPSPLADFEALSGSKSTNPVRTCVALVGATRPTGAQASNNAEAVIVVDYHVTFYQPTLFTTA